MESKACFIAGTGTDIGKTYVSALILKKLAALGSAAYYKAAMSGSKHDGCGNPIAEDAVFVKEFAGIEQSVESMCHYVYGNPYSPHLAARVANRQVEMKEVMRGFDGLAKTHDYLIVEGSG
ncbi:MAG: dethiobiotin synthase, partial [Clostridiales bacterium]|nr:dethiobiotin synthase [Clostridiales bacterium]